MEQSAFVTSTLEDAATAGRCALIHFASHGHVGPFAAQFARHLAVAARASAAELAGQDVATATAYEHGGAAQ